MFFGSLRALLLCLLAFVAIYVPSGSYAASFDTQYYRRAFATLDAGHPEAAALYADRGQDLVLNKILRSYYMEQPANNVSYSDMMAFITENPEWPNMHGILMMIEQKLPPGLPDSQIINWFTSHPALTLTGFYRWIDALTRMGQNQEAERLIVARWTEGDFSADELTAFTSRFDHYLTKESHEARLDHLLWKGNPVDVRRMFPYVDDSHKALAEIRLALANPSSKADSWLERVPNELQNDPGLLCARLRWYVRNHMDDEALDILEHAPDSLGNIDAWWEQSQIMIRRVMDLHNYSTAYSLAARFQRSTGKTLNQSEFLAGWLALRFLNRPDNARVHFQALYESATTPISRARGAYWLGRTYEVLGDTASAHEAYENAAVLNITYYGQLASTRLYSNPMMTMLPEPAIPEQVRQNFLNRDLIQAVRKLNALGEIDRAHHFFHTAIESCTQRADFVLLMDVAYQLLRPDFAIETAKAANQKNILTASGGYPILSKSIPHPPEPAFTHAVIRQESMFNVDAESPVGAKGLMQLMPSTARDVAKELGIKFKASRLNDPTYNLRLGTSFVQNQIDTFNGSYILALAGYNAGPRHVREWITQLGDPRSPDVDVIDWVEQIPVAETRNYVQRIIENLQIYRARLNGGTVPLMIIKDLKR